MMTILSDFILPAWIIDCHVRECDTQEYGCLLSLSMEVSISKGHDDLSLLMHLWWRIYTFIRSFI